MCEHWISAFHSNLEKSQLQRTVGCPWTHDLFSSSFSHHNSYVKIKVSLEIMLLSFWANWAVIWGRRWGTEGTGSQLHSLLPTYVRPHLGLCPPELWEPFGEFTENLCSLRTDLSSEGNFWTHWATFFKPTLVFDFFFLNWQSDLPGFTAAWHWLAFPVGNALGAFG